MLPDTGEDRKILQEGLNFVEYPTRTYALDFENQCIKGITDGLEAMRQAVQLIISTERFIHEIYSWNYGIELECLIGQQAVLAQAKAIQNIRDALLWDERITAVTDFDIRKEQNKILLSFNVQTMYGDIAKNMEVVI